MTRGRLPGGGGSSVVGKRETRLYEPEERLQSSSRGVKTGAFCSASKNASESISFPFKRVKCLRPFRERGQQKNSFFHFEIFQFVRS